MTANDSTPGTSSDRNAPLIADASRQAVPSIRGYVYQIAHTALAWARLQKLETIYLEGAEDFDRLGRANEALQVKDYHHSITLRTIAVKEFICNAWLNRQRNPERNIMSRLLTTARPTFEKGKPFDEPGIEFWRETAGKEPSAIVLSRAAAIGEFLLSYDQLPTAMVEVLRRRDALKILGEVINPCIFDVGLPQTADIEQQIRAQLALVATNDGFLLTNIDNALNATFKYVWDTVTKETERMLTLGTLIDVLMATTRMIPPKSTSVMVRAQARARIMESNRADIGRTARVAGRRIAICPGIGTTRMPSSVAHSS